MFSRFSEKKFDNKSSGFIDLFTYIHKFKCLNEQNVIQRFELAHKYSLDKLKTKCIDLMMKKGKRIIKSDAFMDCSQQHLKTSLELGIWEGEKSMTVACIKWAKRYYEQDSEEDPKNIRMVMGEFFELIPFVAMNPLHRFSMRLFRHVNGVIFQ